MRLGAVRVMPRQRKLNGNANVHLLTTKKGMSMQIQEAKVPCIVRFEEESGVQFNGTVHLFAHHYPLNKWVFRYGVLDVQCGEQQFVEILNRLNKNESPLLSVWLVAKVMQHSS